MLPKIYYISAYTDQLEERQCSLASLHNVADYYTGTDALKCKTVTRVRNCVTVEGCGFRSIVTRSKINTGRSVGVRTIVRYRELGSCPLLGGS